MHAVLRSHPHRIALTNLGRVEVYQKIGGPETGDVSPAGPHTHVLPKLLRSGRTHSANTPIRDGLTPCAYVYPGNPVIGPRGEDRRFDPRLHDAFQTLLQAFGPRDLVDTKKRVISHVMAGDEPQSFGVPAGRYHRAAVRVSLRQLARTRDVTENGQLASQLQIWRVFFDQAIDPMPSGEESDEG